MIAIQTEIELSKAYSQLSLFNSLFNSKKNIDLLDY